MSNTPFRPIRQARPAWRESVPVSVEHDDPYFSLAGGSEETRHVFLQGNQLAQRFSELADGDSFRVGETGFGTGLNFLETWQLFSQQAPSGARLEYVATEAFPLRPADLARAHTAWPQHHHLAQQLLHQWPAASPGYHHLEFDQGRVQLTLLFGDSSAMLEELDGQVDAWLLDGFAPARNDSMWHAHLYTQLARLSHANTTLATYTAAGHVRRGLTAVGFRVEKAAGFAGKRHMTRAWFDQQQTRHAAPPIHHVAVIGAGLAGATCAAALAARGKRVTVLDPDGIASHGSGNLAGIVYSSPSAHITTQNRFYLASYLHALRWLTRYGFPRHAQDGALNGLLQLPGTARHRDKAEAALQADFWPDSVLQPGDERHPGSYHLPGAGFLRPAQWCEHLLNAHSISCQRRRVTAISETDNGVTLELDSQDRLDVDAVVLACASHSATLWPLDVQLRSIRGQVTLVRSTPASSAIAHALCHSGYWTPALDGLHCVGASFNLREHSPDVNPADDRRNLDELKQHAPQLWHAMGGEHCDVAGARVGFRCQSPDFLPLAGALSTRVWCSIAHGSRGITGTPLCADLIAASICGALPPVDRSLIQALSPKRFSRRRSKRQATDSTQAH